MAQPDTQEMIRKYKEHKPLEWNSDPLVQLKYELELVNKKLAQASDEPITTLVPASIQFNSESETETTFDVNYRFTSKSKKATVMVRVHDQPEQYTEPALYILKYTFAAEVDQATTSATLRKPSVPGFYDVVLSFDGEEQCMDRNVVFGFIRPTQWIKVEPTSDRTQIIFTVQNLEELSKKHRSKNAETALSTSEKDEDPFKNVPDYANEGDCICIYHDTHSRNDTPVYGPFVLRKGTVKYAAPVKDLRPGRYYLKYFQTPAPTPTTPYIHIQSFEI